MLREWRDLRGSDGPIIGGKLPFLCQVIPEMVQAFGAKWLAIVPDRPTLDSARSAAPGRFWQGKSVEAIDALFRPVQARQDADLASWNVPALRVPFTDMLASPAATVDRLIAFCWLAPTPEQRQAAIAFIDPQFNHHSNGIT
jgi:hypothetical protein